MCLPLSVCVAPAQISLTHVKLPDGKWLLHGKKATGFTNSEEEAVGKTKVWTLLEHPWPTP
jgi:putative intracellular protease/amidase